MSIGNWYRVGTVAVTNGSVNVVGTGTFWTSQCNPGDRFTVDGENWYEVNSIVTDTSLTLLSVGGSGAFAGATATNLPYAIDRNFTNNLNANIAASVASLVAQYQANSNGPLSGLFANGAAATPGIGFLNEASTGLFHPATGIAALAVQGAEFLRAVGTAGGVPAMLGIGQTAPANAFDLFCTSNALYGARIQNSSAGTAARAALQLGNTSAAAQVLNLGVNGAAFTANGVLSPSRGFVEGPNGVDFASAVTSGTAFSWGAGAAYAQKMMMDAAGNLSLAAGGKLGVGMVPVNVLDITQTQNGPSVVSLLNASNGTAAGAEFSASNGTHSLGLYQLGTSWTTSGMNRQDGSLISANGTGGLTLATAGAQPIYFGINGTEAMRLDATNHLLINQTTNPSSYVLALTGGLGLTVGSGLDAPSSSKGIWVAKDNLTYNGFTLQYNASNGASLIVGNTATWAEAWRTDVSGNFALGTTSSAGARLIVVPPNSSGTRSFAFYSGDGIAGNGPLYSDTADQVHALGESSAHSATFIRKNNTTSRSVSAAGTLNASGADYAEYRQLIPSLYGLVAKGGLLGYNVAGLMTNVFADVVGRVLPKSTAPSYVGNDTWGSEAAICAAYGLAAPGSATLADGTADAGYAARLAAYESAMETERVKWDRIALCGVVPVNVMGLTTANIGQYLVPCAASDGTITATAVAKASLTLGQYIDSFGTIEQIGADGRPLVTVKNA